MIRSGGCCTRRAGEEGDDEAVAAAAHVRGREWVRERVFEVIEYKSLVAIDAILGEIELIMVFILVGSETSKED